MLDRAELLALINDIEAEVDRRFAAIAVKAGGYPAVRADYKRTIDEVLSSFGTSEQSVKVTAAQNALTRAMVEAFQSAFDLGFEETSGAEQQDDKDAQDWLNARVEAEQGYIKEMFQSLKDLRAEFWGGAAKAGDIREFVAMRAEGYINSLDAVNSAGRMWGKKNQILTWQYGDTEHCDTCLKLNGQKHKAIWYLSRDYIPGKPGASMTCGGYRCKCTLLGTDGEAVTI